MNKNALFKKVESIEFFSTKTSGDVNDQDIYLKKMLKYTFDDCKKDPNNINKVKELENIYNAYIEDRKRSHEASKKAYKELLDETASLKGDLGKKLKSVRKTCVQVYLVGCAKRNLRTSDVSYIKLKRMKDMGQGEIEEKLNDKIITFKNDDSEKKNSNGKICI